MTEWFEETLHAGARLRLRIDRLLREHVSPHQHLRLFENATFGRVLTLDDITQTTEKDEFIYHEMLAHQPIFAHGAVRRVLIVGGGDGGALEAARPTPSSRAISGNRSWSQLMSTARRRRATQPATTESSGGSVFATTTSPASVRCQSVHAAPT